MAKDKLTARVGPPLRVRTVVVQEERARLARLRGDTLTEEKGPGARGIEHVARNPSCTLLRVVTGSAASPAQVMERVIGAPAREGQSPFALAHGRKFELRLLDEGAVRLLTLYRDAARLTAQDVRVINVAKRVRGSSPAVALRRKVLTRKLLLMKLRGDPMAPNLIVKPRMGTTLLGVSYDVEPDVLVASSRDPFYRVAEIKSYVDRRGKTKPADISSACRQAAVGVYALSETVAGLAVANPVLYVPDIPAVADVIMRKPQSMRAVLYAQPIESEYASVAAIPQMPPQDIAALEALLQSISPTATLSDRAVIDAIAIHYLDTCREHCPLYGYCKTRALEAGDPAVLDVRAREVLAPAGDLRRGYALREGTVTSYRSPEEEDLALRLREVDREWKEALAQ